MTTPETDPFSRVETPRPDVAPFRHTRRVSVLHEPLSDMVTTLAFSLIKIRTSTKVGPSLCGCEPLPTKVRTRAVSSARVTSDLSHPFARGPWEGGDSHKVRWGCRVVAFSDRGGR